MRITFSHRLLIAVAGVACFCCAAWAKERPLTPEERIEIIRGMAAERATAKVMIPRSKKALPYSSEGTWDKLTWDDAAREHGPAARAGDLVQVTKIEIEQDKIVFEINGGWRGGRKWYERIEVGTGTRTTPIGNRPYSVAPAGTSLSLHFKGRVPPLKASEIKKMLAPVLDFELRTATEQYVDTLPEPVQAAIREKRAVEGMDREMVMLALGRPERKIRETRDGEEIEDWIYGVPPGRMVFVTFQGEKVIQVKEAYAGLGGSVAPPLPPLP